MTGECTGRCEGTTTPTIPRDELVQQAFRLQWLTVAWMVVETAVTLWSGVIAHSIV